jgi:hypothetical protein
MSSHGGDEYPSFVRASFNGVGTKLDNIRKDYGRGNLLVPGVLKATHEKFARVEVAWPDDCLHWQDSFRPLKRLARDTQLVVFLSQLNNIRL